MDKEAAILPKLIRLGATDIPKTPRLLMRHRTPAELGALENRVGGAINKHITQPIEHGLNSLGASKAIGHGASALSRLSEATPVIPGTSKYRLFPEFGKGHQPARQDWAMSKGKQVVRTIAENPVAALAPGGTALPFIDRALGKFFPIKTAEAFMDELTKIAEVQPYQQKTEWSCSAACLKAVLDSYGSETSEEQAIQAIGARDGRGAEVTDIADGARKLGFEAFDYDFESLDQVKLVLDKGIPIICDFQSFNHAGKGHYVVLTKIAEAGAHIMDPNTPGNYRLLTTDHLEARWWDWTMAKPHQLKIKWGVVVLLPGDSHDPE